jgi:hypothetical protein
MALHDEWAWEKGCFFGGGARGGSVHFFQKKKYMTKTRHFMSLNILLLHNKVVIGCLYLKVKASGRDCTFGILFVPGNKVSFFVLFCF